MVTIKANRTTVGEYGKLRRDDTAVVRPSVAKHLVKEGIATIVSDDGTEEAIPAKEYGITIRQGGETVFNSNEDRKIIKKDTVIKPTEPEPEKKNKEQAESGKYEQKETPKKEYQNK